MDALGKMSILLTLEPKAIRSHRKAYHALCVDLETNTYDLVNYYFKTDKDDGFNSNETATILDFCGRYFSSDSESMLAISAVDVQIAL